MIEWAERGRTGNGAGGGQQEGPPEGQGIESGAAREGNAAGGARMG